MRMGQFAKDVESRRSEEILPDVQLPMSSRLGKSPSDCRRGHLTTMSCMEMRTQMFEMRSCSLGFVATWDDMVAAQEHADTETSRWGAESRFFDIEMHPQTTVATFHSNCRCFSTFVRTLVFARDLGVSRSHVSSAAVEKLRLTPSWRCQHQKGLIFSTHSGNQVEVRMIATTRVIYTYMQGFNPRSAMWCLKVDPLTPSINCFIRALLSKSSFRLRPRP